MSAARANVLVVVLDSVRADHLGCYGHAGAETPALDALAAESVRFTNALSESTWTVPVAGALLTGLAPREHRLESTRLLPEGVPALAELMRQAGYATFGASGNPHVGAATGLARGFETFFELGQRGWGREMLRRKLCAPLGLGDGGGAALVERFGAWLPTSPEPWFATVWINDAHHPYRTPGLLGVRSRSGSLPLWQALKLHWQLRRPWRIQLTPGLQAQLGAVYAHAVSYVSRLVGWLLEAVSGAGQADETVVIVAGDHGDMLGERGLIGHGPTFGMYQPLVRVPLLLRVPGMPAASSSALVQVADIAQTVASLAGVADQLAPTAAERVDLRDAAASHGRVAAFCEREPLTPAKLSRVQADIPWLDLALHAGEMAAAVAEGWKLIARESGPSALYRLGDDPAETRDRLDEQPERAKLLRSLLSDFQARATPHAATAGQERRDAAVVDRRLRELGYE